MLHGVYLQVLVLSGLFCIFLAVYENFEYLFCYDEEKRLHRRLLKLSRRARQLATNGGGNQQTTSILSSHDPLESSRLLESESGEAIAMEILETAANESEEHTLFEQTAVGQSDAAEERRQLVPEQMTNHETVATEGDQTCQRIAQRFSEGLLPGAYVRRNKIN